MKIPQVLQNEIEDSKRWIECTQEDSTYKGDLYKRIELISNVSIVIIMTDTNSSKELNSGYLATYFYRVPKKNHNAISQNLKKFIPWFVSNGVRL